MDAFTKETHTKIRILSTNKRSFSQKQKVIHKFYHFFFSFSTKENA